MNGEPKPILVRQNVRWLPADMDTPISLFLGMAGKGHGILLESAEVDGRWGRYSVLACDMALYLSCRGGRLECRAADERFAPLSSLSGMPFVQGLREAMRLLSILPDGEAALPPITRSLCGYLGYGMAGLFEPRLAPFLPPEEAECVLCLPGTLMLFDHLYNRLAQVSLGAHRPVSGVHASSYDALGEGGPAGGPVERGTDAAGFVQAVDGIRRMLREGEAVQAVPSVHFSTPFRGDALALYRRMRSASASPYMFFMRLPEITLFGSSPEVMVQCAGGRLLVAPSAGSCPRGNSVSEDEALAEALLADPSKRAEHMMLVDLARSDLGRIAKTGTVEVERLMTAERFSHVMHLTSRIRAELREGLDAVDVLSAVFPAGAVSGMPRMRAMEMIAGLERRPRGPYGGCIGWLGLDKGSVHLDTGIAVRTMWVRGGRLEWQVGSGIVHDSPSSEAWGEVCRKSDVMWKICSETGAPHVPAHR